MTFYDFFIFAGEPSGDLHGEALLKSLYALSPDLHILGVGGPRMRAIGLTSLLPMEEFQVMGFTAVLCALPKILRHLFFLTKKILEANPKVVVCIDYPGFCLRLERRLRKKGFTGKIVHYISPTVWAHGKSRVPFLEKYVDLLLTIFPFEKAYFSPEFRVEYVGHPLIERIASYNYQPSSFAKEKRVIALFPGSRKKEIDLNFPLQVKTLKKILLQEKDLIGAISVSKQEFIPLLKATLKKEEVSLENIHFVAIEKTYELMASSFLAIAKSGTVTLELALHKVPTIVLYKIAPIDLFIAKNILRIRLPFYCIVNIILQKEIFKELIGPFAQEESLLIEAKKLLEDTTYYSDKKKLCEELISYMGTDKASDRAAALLLTTSMKMGEIFFHPIDGSGSLTISWSSMPKGDATQAIKGNGVGFFSEKKDLLSVIFDEVTENSDKQTLEFDRDCIEITVKKGKVTYTVTRGQGPYANS